MTTEELEATVLAQGCLLRALSHKAVRTSEKLSLKVLLEEQVNAQRVRMKAGDPAALAAFNGAFKHVDRLLPAGSELAQ